MTEKIGAGEYVGNQIAQLKEKLASYQNNLGLNFGQPPKIEEYLKLTKEQLQKFTSDECGYVAFELLQYAGFVQSKINEEMATVGFCEKSIDRAISKTIGQYGKIYSWQEKRMTAVRDNEYAFTLEGICIEAQARVHKLSFITDKIRGMADSLLKIQQNKRGRYGDKEQ